MRETPMRIRLLDTIALKTATFTAATTGIITAVAHGLKTGDPIILTTADTLPAGLALLTRYYVIRLSADTFKVSLDRPHDSVGAPVTITDTGTGAHTFTVSGAGEPALIKSYRHKEITLSSLGLGAGDTVTVKFVGAHQEELPDFDAAKAKGNDWDYLNAIDLEDGSSIDGDVGVPFATSDDLRKFAVNADGFEWITAIITAQSDVANTSITADLNAYND